MFTVKADPSRNRVEFAVVGSMTDDEAVRLGTAIRAAAAQAKAGAQSFDVLADMREAAVLTQTAAGIGEATMAWCAANGMTRSAAVTKSVLGKMQGERISQRERHQSFATPDEGVAWLDGLRPPIG